ncbi:O-methyltransferase [Ulvibacterium sp.]|uniref:O-methyltransferase n=1 Tax=Ulvibacterium sp. TaxID=2665914 RepID=UPI003BAB3B98
MKGNGISIGTILCSFFLMLFFQVSDVQSQEKAPKTELDKKVEAFLEGHKGKWRDMNVPSSDGKLLYDIILKNGYTKGLEIGTSTGHSTIWIAWAFSKTGGKLITIDIDETRHKQALANLKEAGLLDYVDARLADAHELVKELSGTFDFVFSDADKGWYINYFKDVAPKLERGGCFTAHNVRPKGTDQRGMRGTKEYLEYVMGLDTFTTTVDNSGGGLAISYKN